MANPTAAMLVVGDEILSGRTRDANMHHLASRLTETGIDLNEVRIISDDHEAIVEAVEDLSRGYDHLFTSGGIGPTHDDITADAVAAAMKAPIGVRDDALAVLKAHYDRQGTEINDARRRMARIPDGATLIDNPISAAPGFTLRNVHVMAGVPAIFQAMVGSLLPTLTGGKPLRSVSLRIAHGEGDIAEALGALANALPDVSFGSYPFIQNGLYGTNIVARSSDPTALETAVDRLVERFPDAQL